MVTLHDKHPLWPIVRMAVLGSIAIGVLRVTANNFDAGELTAAGVVGLASVLFDVMKKQATRE